MSVEELLKPELLELLASCSEQSYTYLCDLDSDTTRWSEAAVQFFGLPEGLTLHTADDIAARMHPEDVAPFRRELESVRKGETDQFFCISRMKRADGTYVWTRSRGHVNVSKQSGVRLLTGSLLNLESLRHYDAITGLPSGASSFEQVDRVLQAGQRGVMMLFGLDNFKWVNDLYGYPGGDRILRHIGQKLNLIPHVQFSRTDGDKFLCLLTEDAPCSVEELFDSVQKIASDLPAPSGESLHLTISCGVARFPEDAAQSDALRICAEYALEYAKNKTQGSVIRYSPSMHERAVNLYRLRGALHYAIEHDFEGFWLVYQPLIRTADKSLFGAEALLRFTMPDGQLVSPSEFIPILEDDGMIREVGEWVLRTALKQVHIWRSVLPDFCVSVNVSYLQMEAPQFCSIVMDALEESGNTPSCLLLELTESCRHSRPERLQGEFQFFANHAVCTALDDFGTGYSSIDILRRLMPPWIKIDHTLISSITESQMDRAILEYILQLCHHARIKVCVEGIENQEILRIVQQYEPQLLQGYYFSKPLATQEFEELYIKPYRASALHRKSNKGETNMRIAVTYSYEDGTIFQHFGHTKHFKLYDVQDGSILSSLVVDTNGSGHGALTHILNELSANVLICGGIGGGAQTALAAANIKLYGGVSGKADEAVAAYLAGNLDFDPNARCDHHDEHHGAEHTCGDHGCGGHCGAH